MGKRLLSEVFCEGPAVPEMAVAGDQVLGVVVFLNEATKGFLGDLLAEDGVLEVLGDPLDEDRPELQADVLFALGEGPHQRQ
jgi:hypothetical protein